MDFTIMKFSFWIFKNMRALFLLDFFILIEYYDISMCDGKKL
jgi:hypothetical protein